MSKVFVGNISSVTRDCDLRNLFEKHGTINRVDVKVGFAFVEFDEECAADDAIRDIDGNTVDDKRLVVERAKSSGGRGGGDRGGFQHRRGDYSIIVEGLGRDTSWQDLKDFAREAGHVIFSDVRILRGERIGTIEYENSSDYDWALRNLDGAKIDGYRVRLEEDRPNEGRRGYRSRSRSPYRSRRRSPRRSPSPRRRSPSPRRRSPSPRRRSPSPRRSRDRSPARSASPRRD